MARPISPALRVGPIWILKTDLPLREGEALEDLVVVGVRQPIAPCLT